MLIEKCRVGMTTNPTRRKAEWEAEIPNTTDWAWFGHYNSRKDAQAFETYLASIHECESHHGGREPENNNPWWVYKFTYLENCAEPTILDLSTFARACGPQPTILDVDTFASACGPQPTILDD